MLETLTIISIKLNTIAQRPSHGSDANVYHIILVYSICLKCDECYSIN